MELLSYVKVIWQRKWIIVVTMLIAAAVAAAVTSQLKPVYRSTIKLRLLTTTQGEVGSLVEYNIWYADRLLNTYVQIVQSRPILDELMEQVQLELPPEIEVQALTNTELIEVSVLHDDPRVATHAANAMADILIEHSRNLYTGSGRSATEILGEQLVQNEKELNKARAHYEEVFNEIPPNPERIADARRVITLNEDVYFSLLRQYEQARAVEAIRANTVSVVEPALFPEEPFKPNIKLNLALGIMVGLVGGLGLAFVFNNLDSTLYDLEQIKQVTRLPVLGEIPKLARKRPTALLASIFPESEAFRRLRTNIFALERELPIQTILVTSADPSEGKSTMVAGLAFTMAQAKRKVLIVDADLRLPTQHRIYDLSNEVGLSSVLAGDVRWDDAVQPTSIPGIQVLTSGPLAANPFELLSTPSLPIILQQLQQQFDVVLLDTPAFLTVSDASVLAPVVDGVILLVGCGQARRETVRSVCDQLQSHTARILGVIVNRTQKKPSRQYQKYYRAAMALQDKSYLHLARVGKSDPARDAGTASDPAYQPHTFSKS